MASESEQLREQQTEDQRLCALVDKMSPEQLDQLLRQESNGPIVFMHVAYCDSPICKEIFAECKKRAAHGEVSLSLHSQWKKYFLIREVEFVLNNMLR